MNEHDRKKEPYEEDRYNGDEMREIVQALRRAGNVIDCNEGRQQWTLRAIRRELRITQAEVAEGMHRSQSFVSRLESTPHPDLWAVLRYGNAIGAHIRVHLRMPRGEWRELDVLQWNARDRG